MALLERAAPLEAARADDLRPLDPPLERALDARAEEERDALAREREDDPDEALPERVREEDLDDFLRVPPLLRCDAGISSRTTSLVSDAIVFSRNFAIRSS